MPVAFSVQKAPFSQRMLLRVMIERPLPEQRKVLEEDVLPGVAALGDMVRWAKRNSSSAGWHPPVHCALPQPLPRNWQGPLRQNLPQDLPPLRVRATGD